jgi:hypothetical protein
LLNIYSPELKGSKMTHEKTTIMTPQQRLTHAVIHRGTISDFDGIELAEICSAIEEPARPSACCDWAEKFAVPLLRLLADRIKEQDRLIADCRLWEHGG